MQYHFGSRLAVIRAVIGRTMDPIDAERNMLLDHLESTGATLTTRSVLEVVVRPLARQLRTPEGRRIFRIGAQLINHPPLMTDAGGTVPVNTSITRCAAYILPSLDHLPTPVVAERTSQVTGFIIRACGDQARLMDSITGPAGPVRRGLHHQPGGHHHGHPAGADRASRPPGRTPAGG